ncbi:ATP-binding protein [Jatrophihabitans endophyticus]|uniref:ATP-binding protein n=1 Tax=Jatrophihabitans endophyticus TaxID=1206085 RepID=UPI0019E7AEF8|nr:ATP-binding protein [Jatrophihabitans endophyticus]MBE7186971.1 ATP-binding protein [Jatrophihabitans endophyticus]
MQPSPYTPGEVARDVPGRAVQLAQVDERLSYLLDLGRLLGRIRIDVAARGIGKTSLLREMQRHAEARGALTAWVTAGESTGLVAAVAAELERLSTTWRGEAAKRLREAAGRLTITVGVPGVASLEARPRTPLDGPVRGVREFEQAVRAAVEGARRHDARGFVLFLDEIQAADADGLRTLAYAWQHLQSEAADLPAGVFAAGLPTSPEVIARVVTFSERFAYRPLDRLDPDAAMLALVAPARALGVEWDRDALASAVALTQGFPYSVQLIGDATWAAAGYPAAGAVLTLAQVTAGERAMQVDLDALFRSRWENATPAERRLIRVMAELGGDRAVQRADIAARMGTSTAELSVPRARLLDKGLVQAAGRGKLEFTIPGFADYVLNRAEWTQLPPG